MSDEVEGGNEADGFDQLDDFFVEQPDPEAEDAGGESEVEDTSEVADEATDAVPSDDDEPEGQPETAQDKPDIPQMVDKELQKLQQLRATLERQVAAAQANPTPEAIQKAEATKSRLDAIIDSRDDVDPYTAAVTLAEEGKAHEAKLADLQKAVDTTAGMSSQQVAAIQSQMARLQFKIDHPSLADRYDELAQAAAAEVDGMLGEAASKASPEVLMRLDGAAFERLIKAEEAKFQAENEPATDAPPPRQKPVATSPIKNKSGKSSKPEETEEQRIERLLSNLSG